MVSPYSAGTLTLQEAPSFAWRTNDSGAQPRAARELLALGRNRFAPLVGLQRRVMRPDVGFSEAELLPRLVHEYDRPYRHTIATFDVERNADKEHFLLPEKFIDIQ